MKQGKFNVLIGAQAGSEAKGKMSAYLVKKYGISVISMAASPNAGHTAYVDGQKYVSYHLPVGMVANPDAHACLGPSSVINVEKFKKEMNALGVSEDRVHIHPRTTIITSKHREAERTGELLKIGTTNQGVGGARMEKLMRTNDVILALSVPKLWPMITDTVVELNERLRDGITVFHECTQGFDLDLEHGIDHHYCTSKMINPAMAMAEAGVSPHFIGHIYGVLRPYPIRVNNREGSSGPYAEAAEITWDEVRKRCGAPYNITEITTTTKLVRRVFEFSWQRFNHFCRVCAPDRLCLQFANYINWEDYGKNDFLDLSQITKEFMKEITDRARVEGKLSCRMAYVGTNAEEEGMVDMEAPDVE